MNDSWRNLNPEIPPKSHNELNCFLVWNNAPMCFFKAQGYWYKLCKDGIPKLVARTLYLLSLKEWLNIALNEKFIGDIK